MNIATITKEDFEADDILATLVAARRGRGLPRAGRLGRPRHHPAGRRRRHAALPERARRLRTEGLRPRRRARAVRDRAGAVSRDRRARRRDQRQPAGRRQGRREDRGQVDPAVRHRRTNCSPTPTRSRGVVGKNLRDQHDRVDAQPQAQPPGHATSSCRSVPPTSPAIRSTRPPCARCSSACSSARLLDRVFKLEGTAEDLGRGRGARCPRASIPPVRTLVDEELAKWLDAASAERHDAARAARRHPQRPDRRVRDREPRPRPRGSRGRRGRPDYAALERVARLATRPSTCTTPSASSSRSPAPASSSTGSPFDTALGAWLLRPSTKADTPRRARSTTTSARPCPSPTRASWCPRPRPMSPATEAWYIAAARRRADGAPRRGVARRRRATSRCRSSRCWRAWSCRASPCRRRCSAELNSRLGAAGGRDRAAGVRRDRPRGEPRLAEAAARGAVRPARHAQDPREQDRVLDGCRSARRPAGAASASVPRAAAPAPRRHQDPADRRDPRERGIGSDGRVHTTYEQTGSATGPHLVERPEPAEHPDQDRGRPRGAFRVPRRARVSRPC